MEADHQCYTSDTAKIRDLMEQEGIAYKVSEDGLTISVDKKRFSDATLALYSHDIPSSGITLDDLLNNSLAPPIVIEH